MMSPETEVAVAADRFGRPEWRVEYSDHDGACCVTIFAGPNAERRARDYHAALKSGTLKPAKPASQQAVQRGRAKSGITARQALTTLANTVPMRG